MYELITAVLQPYTFLLLAMVGMILWVWFAARPRSRILTMTVGLNVLMCLISLPLIGQLAVVTLEWPYPPSVEVPTRDDTIVVLAGSGAVDNQAGTAIRIGGETMFRCQRAIQLYERAGGCRVVVSGGRLDPSKPAMTLAEAMRDFLVQVGGIRSEDVTLEMDSANTYENAQKTSQLMRDRSGFRVFLVTSAAHMLRAEGCFRRQGIVVVPAACNHRVLRIEVSSTKFIPSIDGIRSFQFAFHEWMGIMWYWLRGRI